MCYRALLLLAASSLYAQGPLACPASIILTESAAPLKGFKATEGKVQCAFERISVYNVEANGREYDLAPDDEKQSGRKIVQTWRLKDYRTMNVVLRCRYRDTPVVLFADVPAALATCTFSFEMDGKGRITGKPSASCR